MKHLRFFLFLFFFLGATESLTEIEVQKKESAYGPLKTFAQSLNLIEENHPQKQDRQKLIEGAIRGMLFDVDPYADLMNPEKTQNFYKQNQKVAQGFGFSISFKDQKIIVTSVFKGSSAHKNKMQVGDRLTHIQGQSVESLSYDEVLRRIQKNPSLKLRVSRSKEPMISLTLSRGKFQVPSLFKQKINDHFLYVRIFSFKESSYKDFKKVLRIQRKGKNHLQSRFKGGILLDLRQNSGGMVDQALLMADLFISEGLLISTKGQQNPQKFYAKSLGTLQKTPLVILIDEYTASASEILTSALKENEYAFVVGNKSFGKGSIQSFFNLDNGYTLKLTVSEYFSPLGNVIEKKGIEPHLYLGSQDAFTEEEIHKINYFKYNFFSQNLLSLEPVQKLEEGWQSLVEQDPLLEKSFEVLQRLTL